MLPTVHALTTVFLCADYFVYATISDNFRQFVRSRYGRDVAELLARDDLGAAGSYGGGEHIVGQKTTHSPVIFVHGLMTSAGTTQPMAAFFQASGGYDQNELYATTYGPRGNLLITPSLDCQYAQTIRYMIIAVSEYTNNPVHVIAYSLGVPLARKAILGGTCVEGGDLGRGTLTQYVNTFLGVAGPNFGVASCSLPLAGYLTSCNSVNGLRCGSAFFNDVNSRQKYEGQTIYAMQSTADNTIGTTVCGRQNAAIPGANYVLTFEGLSHIQVCTLTAEQQFNLVTKHSLN